MDTTTERHPWVTDDRDNSGFWAVRQPGTPWRYRHEFPTLREANAFARQLEDEQ